MNIEQKTKILKIIKNNCHILALSQTFCGDSSLSPHMQKLESEFGLRLSELVDLQDINDSEDDVQIRRKRLKDYIEGLDAL